MLRLHLDRTTPIPLHYQLQEQLRDAIRRGDLPVGSALPQEPALAAEVGVSRYTLRQAIDALVREGRLARRRGHGTFVTEPPVAQRLGRFYSFARDLAEQGLHPTSRLLRLVRVVPPRDVAEALALDSGERVVELVRLRLLDDEPVIHEMSFLPAARVPGLTRSDVASGSLYDLLEQRYDLRPTHASEEVQAVLLDERIATFLEVPAGSAGFFVERRTFVGEAALEVRQSRIRADRYRFRVDLPQSQLTHD